VREKCLGVGRKVRGRWVGGEDELGESELTKVPATSAVTLVRFVRFEFGSIPISN